MLRFNSTATRSAFMSNWATRPARVRGSLKSRASPLITSFKSGFYFAQVEFAGCSAAGIVGLHQHGRIRE